MRKFFWQAKLFHSTPTNIIRAAQAHVCMQIEYYYCIISFCIPCLQGFCEQLLLMISLLVNQSIVILMLRI